MTDPTPGPPGSPGAMPASAARSWRRCVLAMAGWTLAFSPGLVAWARFAWNDEVASYVLIIPLVSASLIWNARADSPPARPAWGAGLFTAALALLFTFWAWRMGPGATEATRHDYLTPALLGFSLGIVACLLLTMGTAVVRRHVFALAFLGFATPVPSGALVAMEVFFQYTSAEVAGWMMQLIGLPTLRSGLVYQLPGITIEVAKECSGIRSSLVLFIVSIYGGHLILRTRSRRALLTFFVIPLGILRNGFRITTIAALCTHVSPRMIDSPIHHRGGPVFFALSLIPLFLLLFWLRRSEQKSRATGPSDEAVSAASAKQRPAH